MIRPSRPRPRALDAAGVGAVRGAVALGVTTLLGGCGGVMTSDARGGAEAALAEAVVRVHERALDVRAADPAAVDTAAADNLADALTGGNPASLVSTAVTAEGVEVLTTAGVRVEEGGGLFYEQATLGACLLTSATAGSSAGDVGERGTVTTEAVACPAGMTPVVDSAPVQATTIEVERLESPVPMSRPAPCFSGSDDCEGGG